LRRGSGIVAAIVGIGIGIGINIGISHDRCRLHVLHRAGLLENVRIRDALEGNDNGKQEVKKCAHIFILPAIAQQTDFR
jgi:hypothetical protein